MAEIWKQIESSKPMLGIKQIKYLPCKVQKDKTKDSPIEREGGKGAQNRNKWLKRNKTMNIGQICKTKRKKSGTHNHR